MKNHYYITGVHLTKSPPIVGKNNKIVLFEPLEEKKLYWIVQPNASVKSSQYLVYTIEAKSLNATHQNNFTVQYSELVYSKQEVDTEISEIKKQDAQKDNKDMFAEGTPSDYMVSIFSEFGINAQEANMYQSTQESVTAVIKNQRNSVSQVDLTEEFSSLMKYQQAYQAAAKIVNTIDGIYQTTIFKLGNF